MKMAKPVWAAVERRTGEIWFINSSKAELLADLNGDTRRHRVTILVERKARKRR